MGVNWWPAKFKTGANRDAFEAVIKEDHLIFLANQDDFLFGPVIGWDKKRKSELIDLISSTCPSDYLDCESESHRVTVISNNVVFPVEWRIDAYRTIPHWELGENLDRWENHYQQVQSGQHMGYLYEWFLYESNSRLQQGHKELLGLAVSTENSEAKWTRAPSVVESREAIKSSKLPESVAHPVWVEWESKAQLIIDVDSDPRYGSLHNQLEDLVRLTGEWNQTSRQSFQCLSTYVDFEWASFRDQRVEETWPERFFVWARDWESRGFGLYRE